MSYIYIARIYTHGCLILKHSLGDADYVTSDQVVTVTEVIQYAWRRAPLQDFILAAREGTVVPPMSTPRQYDYGKPADTLQEWTSKVKNLQGLVDQDDAEERARLEREIAQTRTERARRRGKSVDLTTPQCACVHGV